MVSIGTELPSKAMTSNCPTQGHTCLFHTAPIDGGVILGNNGLFVCHNTENLMLSWEIHRLVQSTFGFLL